jgi:hypothetical protein
MADQPSIAIARVDLIEHAQIRRPIMAAAAGIMVLKLLGRSRTNRWWNFNQLATCRFQS